MGHLKPDELIDLAGATRPESSAPHLQACGECRRQLADLRAMMAAAADVDVPEPSPLFWDHFSARVHEAVSAEGVPRRASWFSRFALPLSVAASAALIVIAAVTLSPGRGRQGIGLVPAVPVADEGLAAPFPDDPSLDLVADLAAQLDWDMSMSPGLDTHADASVTAVAQLTVGERRELQRLLKEELSRADGAGN